MVVKNDELIVSNVIIMIIIRDGGADKEQYKFVPNRRIHRKFRALLTFGTKFGQGSF